MTDLKNTSPPAGSDQPPASQAAKGPRRWITPVLVLVAALAIGIFGGVMIGHSTATAATSGAPTGNFTGGPGGAGGAGSGFTAGTIVSVDGSTITLKTTDGSTVKVTTKSDTSVTTTSTSKVTDLAAGDTISVVGTTGSDGSVTATRVTEGETALGGGAGGRTGTAPAAQ